MTPTITYTTITPQRNARAMRDDGRICTVLKVYEEHFANADHKKKRNQRPDVMPVSKVLLKFYCGETIQPREGGDALYFPSPVQGDCTCPGCLKAVSP